MAGESNVGAKASGARSSLADGAGAAPGSLLAASSRPLRVGWAVWSGAFLIALLLYAATANRGIQWQDSGWQQYRIVTGQLGHPRGLALVHPLQYYLGRAACRVLDPPFAITLVSCIAGAVAIANLSLVVSVATGRIVPGVVAGAALMLSHTFWQHATHTESYTIVTAVLTAEWLCLVYYAVTGSGRFLVLLAFLNGLGISNHLLAVLATPVDAVVIALAVKNHRLSVRAAVAAVLLWLLGTLPYSALVMATMVRTGDVSGTIHSALFGDFASEVLNVRLGGRTVLLALGYAVFNYPGLTIPLALYALVCRVDAPRLFLRAVKCEFVVYGLFVARYTITDQYSYFFPVYALLALLSGIGLAKVLAVDSPVRRRVVVTLAVITIVWTPPIYVGTWKYLAARGAFARMVGNKPYRDGYRAFFVPWGRGDTCFDVLTRHARELAGPDGAILVQDPTIENALFCAHAIGQVPRGVAVVPIEAAASAEVVARHRCFLEAYLSRNRSVVLVPRDRDHPVSCVPDARWRRDGDLYVFAGFQSPATAP